MRKTATANKRILSSKISESLDGQAYESESLISILVGLNFFMFSFSFELSS
ncbi:hypothetical protein LguiA_022908 [Lonicera macranthoides]